MFPAVLYRSAKLECYTLCCAEIINFSPQLTLDPLCWLCSYFLRSLLVLAGCSERLRVVQTLQTSSNMENQLLTSSPL